MSWILVISLIVLTTILLFKRYKSRNLSHPTLAGPNGWLDIFDILDIKRFLTERMLDNIQKYPKIFRLNGFMFPSVYVISDNTIIKQITIENTKSFQNHSNIMSAAQNADLMPLQDSLFFIRDDDWWRRRKALSTYFTGPKIFLFLELFKKNADVLCDIFSEVKEDEFVNLQPKFVNLTLDVLGEAVFSVQFGCQRDPKSLMAKTYDNILSGFAGRAYVTFFPFWYRYPIKWIQDVVSSTNRLSNMCRTIVKSREKENNSADDFLQALIDLKLDLEKGMISDVFLFTIAGHETTSNLLSWCIYQISKNPEIESKLREEISHVIGKDGEITVDNIESLEYTNCIIQETLRTFPPILMTDRQCNEEVTLDGHIFPKNSIFLMPIWAIHHSEQYWPDPFKFDPTRFDASHKHNIPACAFLPFGSGPRICIGLKFALHETKVALVKLYQKFTFEIDHTKCHAGSAGILGRPKNLLAKVKKVT